MKITAISSATTYITFPKEEFPSIKETLESKGRVYTTRIDQEYDKYTLGMRLQSPFGNLQVIRVSLLEDGCEDHPFKNELTDEQKEILKGKKAKLLLLEKI